jgi:hypothetical protein
MLITKAGPIRFKMNAVVYSYRFIVTKYSRR